MIIATGLGTGYFPVSGTVASILAILIFLPFARWNHADGFAFLIYISITFFLTGLSIWSAALAEKWLKEKDPHKVVIDEIAGFFYAMFLVPATPLYILSAFVLFRLFDVLKPFPINKSQDLPDGVGITADDILAGIAACIIIHVFRWIAG